VTDAARGRQLDACRRVRDAAVYGVEELADLREHASACRRTLGEVTQAVIGPQRESAVAALVVMGRSESSLQVDQAEIRCAETQEQRHAGLAVLLQPTHRA